MMLEVSETGEDEQTYIHIKVQNPSKEFGSYISYEIAMETNDPSFSYQKSSTRRRYSDFQTLSRLLSKQFLQIKLPILPPKEPFKNSFDPEFIQKRQTALQDYLNKLVSDRMYLSSKALHLFLQSSLSMLQIKDIIDGKTSVEIQSPVSIFYDSLLSTGNGEDDAISSESFSNGSISNACAILKPSSESNMNSSIDSKKVSFCDQVTVAEVHMS